MQLKKVRKSSKKVRKKFEKVLKKFSKSSQKVRTKVRCLSDTHVSVFSFCIKDDQ